MKIKIKFKHKLPTYIFQFMRFVAEGEFGPWLFLIGKGDGFMLNIRLLYTGNEEFDNLL